MKGEKRKIERRKETNLIGFCSLFLHSFALQKTKRVSRRVSRRVSESG